MFQQLLLVSSNKIEVYEIIMSICKTISSYLKGRITKDHLID